MRWPAGSSSLCSTTTTCSTPEALEQVAAAIDSDPEADYIYTDEDKVSGTGRHFEPFFKPDWSPERLRTQMYTCHLSVLRRALVEEVGGFDPEFEGSQDWDLVLRVTERARAILHVPRILYHWRVLPSSTASDQTAKPWAFEAGCRAVQAHCDRTALPAKVAQDPADPGILHLEPRLRQQPLVSIVIPTAGTTRDVRFAPTVLVVNCVRSIVERSTYENYEIVCVTDERLEGSTEALLRDLAGERLRLIPFSKPFSFSEKVNLGAIHSHGEHLLLLNDDIEVTTPNWLERMVMYSERSDIGAVGGRLLWGDTRLQHVGIGFNEGLPDHHYRGYRSDYPGYMNAVRISRDCLAVTGACLMTRRDLFDQLGGLSPTLPVNFNDVDYCLKVYSSGHRVVYDPDLVLLHFESSSRDAIVEEWEIRGLLQRWRHVVSVDPFGNPNLRQGMPRLSAYANWLWRPATLARLRRARGNGRIRSLVSAGSTGP